MTMEFCATVKRACRVGVSGAVGVTDMRAFGASDSVGQIDEIPVCAFWYYDAHPRDGILTDMTMLVRDRIGELVAEAVKSAQGRGLLPQIELPDPTNIERPQNPDHGDYASSLPMKMARAARMDPRRIAQIVVEELSEAVELASAEVAPPGFINFSLDREWLLRQVDEIIVQGPLFGHSDIGQGETVQVEFVSVNPTGPIHVGHGRGAILGSTLASILDAAGYAVQREYYINDAGNQMDLFFRSVWARYLQALGHDGAQLPNEGYQGAYMVDLGKTLATEHGDAFFQQGDPEGVKALGEIGMERMLEAIRSDLDRVSVSFDRWFSERSLFDADSNGGGESAYSTALSMIREKGYTTDREGAHWFTATALGGEKDEVILRQTGSPTYFASDIAYHYDKFLVRKFDRVINVWGADHQGHVPRMKAVMRALELDPERLQFILVQLVTLKRGDDVIRVSKRTGDMIAMEEVIDEVGADACRYFFLARSADSQMDFDLDLAKSEAPENPVYYIQYAHARIAGIVRGASDEGLPDAGSGADIALLTEEAEERLIREMLRFPEVVQAAARNMEPHHLPHYALSLATAFHDFYTKHRVLGEEPPITLARLRLVHAARTVLSNVLGMMGMGAPERM
jgi:arginyl-tRNA synthetase